MGANGGSFHAAVFSKVQKLAMLRLGLGHILQYMLCAG